MMKDFRIDKSFRDLIPPLSEEEFAQLEQSILEDGVRDPLVTWTNNGSKPVLVEGHHRLQIIKKHRITHYRVIKKKFDDRDAVKCWIIDNQCGRRNLPLFTKCLLQIQKHEFSVKMRAKENQRLSKGKGQKGVKKSSQPYHFLDELAKITGISRQTIHRVKYIVENGDEETVESLRIGSISINEAFKETRSIVNRSNREEADKNGLNAFRKVKVKGDQNVHHADFRKFSKQLKDDSVKLILTDPLYDADSLPLYADLAEMASKKLRSGGSLITYCGNRYLPDVLAAMTPHLKYYWSMACLHTGGTRHEQHRRNIGVINRWKPILWFVKEKRGDRLDFIRDAVEGKMDKRFHPFGQGVIEAKYFIEHLTKPNDLVFEPFLGGGTTCVAAKEMKRRWIGCDIDKSCVDTTRQRLASLDGIERKKKVLAEKHSIICGDAREVYPKLIQNGNQIDLILFDPPYNIGFSGYNEHHDNYSEHDYIALLKTFQGDTPLVVIQYPEETMKYVVPALGTPDEVLAWCYNSNLPRQFRLISIYGKGPDFSKVKQPFKNPTDKRIIDVIAKGREGARLYDWFSDIQQVKNVSKENNGHPCPLPEELIERLILLLSDKGDVVYDPFLGSGTTMVAAKRLGRRGIGSDISMEYCEMAKERIP